MKRPVLTVVPSIGSPPVDAITALVLPFVRHKPPVKLSIVNPVKQHDPRSHLPAEFQRP